MRNRGFTLIELMIVVAIVAIIAAVAIPSLLASRIAGNEASAMSSMRTIASTQEQYRTRYGLYASGLTDLTNAGYVDDVLGSGVKSGYAYGNSSSTSNTNWSLDCQPTAPGVTGEKYFFINESGILRFSTSGPAGASDPPVD